jgi:hypothetical protein
MSSSVNTVGTKGTYKLTTVRVRPEPASSLGWSFVRAHRFEGLMLLVVVVILAIAEAIAIAYVVTGLFEPIENALGAIT